MLASIRSGSLLPTACPRRNSERRLPQELAGTTGAKRTEGYLNAARGRLVAVDLLTAKFSLMVASNARRPIYRYRRDANHRMGRSLRARTAGRRRLSHEWLGGTTARNTRGYNLAHTVPRRGRKKAGDRSSCATVYIANRQPTTCSEQGPTAQWIGTLTAGAPLTSP